MPVEGNLYILNKLARFFEISLPQLISQLFTTFNLDLFETIYKNLITIYCNLFCVAKQIKYNKK